MSDEAPPKDEACGRTKPHGRQILFYAASGVLGGTLSCSCCGATGRQPDIIEHERECIYRAPSIPSMNVVREPAR